MQLYPECSGPICEVWQAEKWLKEVGDDEIPPMWANWTDPSQSHRHFFVHELAYTRDKKFVVIQRWIAVKEVVMAEVWEAVHDNEVRPPTYSLFLT